MRNIIITLIFSIIFLFSLILSIDNKLINKIYAENLLTIQKESTQYDIKNIVENNNLTPEEKIEILKIFNNEEFLYNLNKEFKKKDNWSLKKIVLSIILGFLYGFAYFATIKKVKAGNKVSNISFGIFSLTSGSMVIINGFIPGSLVYMLSFILAGYVVYLNNRK